MNPRNVAIAALLAMLTGCGAQPAGTAGAKTHMDDSPRLELPDTSEIRRDPRSDTIKSLKGENLSAALDGDSEFQQERQAKRFDRLALMFVATHRDEFRLKDPTSELAVLSISSDKLGLTHVRFEQRYAGLSVADAQLIVHLNDVGEVTGVGGGYHPTPSNLETTPALSIDEARSAAAREVDLPDCGSCPTELVIFVGESHEPRLGSRPSYRLAYRIDTGASLERWQLMVAADTGEILRKLPTALQGTIGTQ